MMLIVWMITLIMKPVYSLRKILLYIKDNEQFIGNTIIDENKFDKVYERMQQGIYIWTP